MLFWGLVIIHVSSDFKSSAPLFEPANKHLTGPLFSKVNLEIQVMDLVVERSDFLWRSLMHHTDPAWLKSIFVHVILLILGLNCGKGVGEI